MKVYVLCLQLGSSRGDCVYEQVFVSADAAQRYLAEQNLEWRERNGLLCTDWLKGNDADIGARWVILEQEVLK